ncbi:hypothetical protein [Roseobacter sp. A03A-229]
MRPVFPAYVSKDGGQTWSVSRVPDLRSDPSFDLRVNPFGSTVFAQGQKSSLRSGDFGATWRLTNLSRDANQIEEFPDYLIASVRASVEAPQISTDNGVTWRDLEIPEAARPRSSFLDATRDQITISTRPSPGNAADSRTFRTTDLGES